MQFKYLDSSHEYDDQLPIVVRVAGNYRSTSLTSKTAVAAGEGTAGNGRRVGRRGGLPVVGGGLPVVGVARVGQPYFF